MATLWTEPAYYEHLRTVIQKEVLPVYDQYSAIRGKVRERMEQRSWPKYCVWAVGICLGLELVLTEGRVLRPPMLLLAVAGDALVGYGLFYLGNLRETSALQTARE